MARTDAASRRQGRDLLRVEELAKSYGPQLIWHNVNFSVHHVDRIGLVGANGSGKSTLLNVLSDGGQDLGSIELADGIRMAHLTQIRDISESNTIEAELARQTRQFRELEEELRSLEALMADPAFYETDYQPSLDRYGELQRLLGEAGGTNIGANASHVLKKLGLSGYSLDQRVSELSGGERAKLSLARTIVGLSTVDLLLLDEPTNHLDTPTTEWLEGFIRDFQGALIIVSHDRYFLDKVCNRIFEVEGQRLTAYDGNYSQYITKKTQLLEALMNRLKDTDKRIARVKQALAHMKSSNKYDKSISAKHHMTKRLQSERARLQAGTSAKRRDLRFHIEAAQKSSNEVATLSAVELEFPGSPPKRIYDGLDLELVKGDRLGLVGWNGAGKTTLLKLLRGDLRQTAGEISVSPGVKIGYFHQDHSTLDFSNTPMEEVQASRPDYEYGQVRAALGRFLFRGLEVEKRLSDLSGGERARIAILKLLLEENNLLLLDEPTNHLDFESCRALEAAINEYDGSFVVVSHDRWFLDTVCDGILELKAGKVTWYQGNYTDYVTAKRIESGELIAET